MTLPVPVTNGYANYEWLFILDAREDSERVPGNGNQGAFMSVTGSKTVRTLESTHCFCCSLITPALHRQSASIAIKAAEAASLIGKIRGFDQKDYCHVQFAVHCCLTQLRFIAIQASLGFHLWVFEQAGHFSDISKSASSESNTIISVVSPVGTARLLIGQRIIILGIGLRASADPKKG